MSNLPQWLTVVEPIESRSLGIGGTDISAILGENPYKSSFDVWLEKTGQAKPLVDNNYLKFGRLLEPVVAREYCEAQKAVIIRPQKAFRHVKRHWQTGSPDALWEESPKGAEIKTSSVFALSNWGETGTDHVPDFYLLQVQWYMSLCDIEEWDLAVLIGGNDFRMYHLNRNKELEGIMLHEAEKFWRDNVLGNKAPDIMATEATKSWIKEKYPRNRKGIRKATNEEIALIQSYAQMKQIEKAQKENLEHLKIKSQQVIGDHAGIECEAGDITWTTNKDSIDIDYKSIVEECRKKIPQEIIVKYTKTKPGSRVLRYTIKE